MASFAVRSRGLLQFVIAPRQFAAATCCSASTSLAFSTTAAPRRDLASGSKAASSRSAAIARSKSSAAVLADLMEGVLAQSEDYDQTIEGDNAGALLQNLTKNAVIAPQELSPTNLLTPYKPKPDMSLAYPLGPPVREAQTLDPFVRYGIDPLEASPMNPWLRTEYCTSMGKIKGRGKTGLQRGSQRRMGKAVRRARSMGIVATFGQSLPNERY